MDCPICNFDPCQCLEGTLSEKRDGKSAKDSGYSLRDWFKGGGWVQAGGKYDGKPCAKQPGQKTKPFCRDADDRANMSKKERSRRAAKKRKEDPNPNRKGKAKMVTASYSNWRNELQLDEGMGRLAAGAAALLSAPYLAKKFLKPKADKALDRGRKELHLQGKPFGAGARGLDKQSYQPEGELVDEGKKDERIANVMGGPTLPGEKGRKAYPPGKEPKPTGAQLPVLKAGVEPEGDLVDEANIGFSNPAINGKPIPYPKGHPKEGKPMSFNKAETEGKQKYDDYYRKTGKRIPADQPLPEEKIVEGKKDACYHKVKSRYSVWPSAYASGALVKCRKVGAANWGNSTKKEEVELDEKCWAGYEKKGMKTMFGKRYPNCVKKTRKEAFEFSNWRDDFKATEYEFIDIIKAEPMKGIAEGAGKDHEHQMARSELSKISSAATRLKKKVKGEGNLKAWVQSKITRAADYIDTAADYMDGNEGVSEGAAWTKKAGKNPSGGLNEKGRKSYERENPGSDLKAPSKKVGNKRRDLFCARMKGMKAKLTSKKTASDPDSRINKSLRAWNC